MTANRDVIKVDDFVKLAQATATVLRGYIRFSDEDSSVILYGRDPYRCPHTPIPRDQIEGLQLGQTHRCSGGPTGFSTMWYAIIYLKKPESPEGRAFEQLLALIMSEERSEDIPRVHSRPCMQPVSAQPCPQPPTGTLTGVHTPGMQPGSAHPSCQQGAVRPYAITQACNPAPGSGWYVELLVLSTGLTWYYGPYGTYNDAYFVFDQLNDYPANQWVALPQYITAGTLLQPWSGSCP
jgi:hypothetical protein